MASSESSDSDSLPGIDIVKFARELKSQRSRSTTTHATALVNSTHIDVEQAHSLPLLVPVSQRGKCEDPSNAPFPGELSEPQAETAATFGKEETAVARSKVASVSLSKSARAGLNDQQQPGVAGAIGSFTSKNASSSKPEGNPPAGSLSDESLRAGRELSHSAPLGRSVHAMPAGVHESIEDAAGSTKPLPKRSARNTGHKKRKHSGASSDSDAEAIDLITFRNRSQVSQPPVQSVKIMSSQAAQAKVTPSSASGAAKHMVDQTTTAATDRQPPKWYTNVVVVNKRGTVTFADADVALGNLRAHIRTQVQTHSRVSQAEIYKALHDAMFSCVQAQQVRTHRLLHSADGLPHLFDPVFSAGIEYHSYIKADAKELYNKWVIRDFDPDILRGITIHRNAKTKDSKTHMKSYTLDPSWLFRKQGGFHGSQGLTNGQWWPLRICLIRDGAHTETQGGIAGRRGQGGAWSVVISGGSGEIEYADIDHGEEIWYCGTDSKNGATTDDTQLLIQSTENKKKKPVRVIRSSNAKNKEWAPKAGLRYDGLYEVMGYELLDAKIQRHRFHLVRCLGQDPIRASGIGVRPSPQELAAYHRFLDRGASGG